MGGRTTLTFAVTGMHCASCGLLIDDAVEDLDGVDSCQTDSRRGRATVRADPAVITVEAIAGAITDAGYHAELVDE